MYKKEKIHLSNKKNIFRKTEYVQSELKQNYNITNL